MTSDRRTPGSPWPRLREVLPAEERLGRSFRKLADEHIRLKRRDDQERIWREAILPAMAAKGLPLPCPQAPEQSAPMLPAGFADALLRDGPVRDGGAWREGGTSQRPQTGTRRLIGRGPSLSDARNVLGHGRVGHDGVGHDGMGHDGMGVVRTFEPSRGAARSAPRGGESLLAQRGAAARRDWAAGFVSRLARARTGVPGVAWAAAAVLVLTLGFAAVQQPGLSFEVASLDGEPVTTPEASGLEGQLVATEDLEATIDFSDESRVVVEPHTTLRLRVDDGGRVVTRIAQGGVRVHVEHHEETDYRFRTGPYEVQVTGTRFSLSYDPKMMKMLLDLEEGSVVVRDQAGGQHVVTTGQRLELPEAPVALGEQSGDGLVRGADGVEVPTEGTGRADGIELAEGAGAEKPAMALSDLALEEPEGAPGARGVVSRVDYLALARDGRFEVIVASAEREGIVRVLLTRSVAELQELAQAARYTGRSALAIRVFEDLSQKHVGSAPARNAAFFLGRIAEERGQSTKALSLYENYLAASPRGLYAAEALGRKMNLVQKSRGSVAARPIAEEYVRRFPKGPYHALARSLLRQSASLGR